MMRASTRGSTRWIGGLGSTTSGGRGLTGGTTCTVGGFGVQHESTQSHGWTHVQSCPQSYLQSSSWSTQVQSLS